MNLLGHYSTILPFLKRRIFPVSQPATAPWSAPWEDPELGRIEITGRLRAVDSDELLVAVHGLGGSVRSGYMPMALAAAEQAGVSCLLLNVRGADGSGEDIAHAGLTDDLRAVFASPVLSGYQRIYLLGYSMGGHLALRYASEDPDPRLRGVVAVSSPLDLRVSAQSFDRSRYNVYRTHVMSGLRATYKARYARRGGPVAPPELDQIRTIRVWDERIVAPRFGFRGADDYYARASAASRLRHLRVRSLYVGATSDPMVPRQTVASLLEGASSALQVHWDDRAGHMGFPSDFNLGQQAPRGLEQQTLAWLRLNL